MSTTPAGWHADPTGRHEHRYWDGSGWTDHVADAGVAATDRLHALADEPTIVHPGLGGEPTAPQPRVTDATVPGAPVPPTAWPPASPVTPPPRSRPSKRNLWIGLAALGVVAVALIAFLVAGADDDGDRAADRTDVGEDVGDADESSGPEDLEDLEDSLGQVDDLPPFDPENLEAYLAALYKDTFGLTDAQAECLASELTSTFDLANPEQTPEVDEMLDVFQRCEIDPADLGGFGDG